MSDRIKLAEAMGWLRIKRMTAGCWFSPDGTPNGDWVNFDPFTDANDDYAVLEWFRSGGNIGRCEYPDWGAYGSLDSYQIGDYARAALKVIATEQGDE